MKILVALLIGLGIGLIVTPAFAEQTELSSKIKEFKPAPVKDCFQTEIDLFEAVRGRLPSPDEADLIVDACMKLGHS